MWAHAIVPKGKQVQESGYSLDPSFFISRWEVVVEPLRPLLERAVPPLDVVSDSKRFLYVINFQPFFECRFVPRCMVYNQERLLIRAGFESVPHDAHRVYKSD